MTAIPVQLGTLPFGSEAEGPGKALARSIFRRMRPTPPQVAERRREHAVPTRTDEALLEAYVDGDRSAFRDLVERYRDELVHFLTRFVGSRAAAEDVFQDTFLQVHLSADTFDATRRLKPWLFTIAANKGRDYHRKHGRRSAVSLSATIGSDDDGQRFVDLMEADLPDPDAPVLDAERSGLVKGVVDAMPSHLREILLLSYFQRMSYNQIAETLEIPLGTVKSRLHTAVASFARAWMAARVDDESNDDDDTRDGRSI
jgi:RNA polymerase sigma-70 factor (ECF subfamily)